MKSLLLLLVLQTSLLMSMIAIINTIAKKTEKEE